MLVMLVLMLMLTLMLGESCWLHQTQSLDSSSLKQLTTNIAEFDGFVGVVQVGLSDQDANHIAGVFNKLLPQFHKLLISFLNLKEI